MSSFFSLTGPFRRLTFRAELARAIWGKSIPPWVAKPFSDRHVRAYQSFLQALAAAGNDVQQQDRVRQRFPAIAAAQQLHTAGDPRQLGHLEGLLLAGESDVAIGQQLGIDPAVVGAYEALFFAVRDRRSAVVWIRKITLRPPRNADSPQLQRYALRWLGYHGGPAVLAALHRRFSTLSGQPGIADVTEEIARDARHNLLFQAVTAALYGELGNRELGLLAKLGEQLANNDKEQAAAVQARQDELKQLWQIVEQVEKFGGSTSRPDGGSDG